MRRYKPLLVWTLWSRILYGVRAANSWATLPVRGPPVLNTTAPYLHVTDVLLGTPPQNTSMMIDIGGWTLCAQTPECAFCPVDGMYDPGYSSSALINPNHQMYGNWSFGGARGNETVMLGGVLQDVSSPIAFIEHISSEFTPRFNGGHLGLFVSQFNQTLRSQNILLRLDEQGQLLNPVWGLRLAGGNGSLTIGALDPNEYEGEVNWVPALGDQPVIHVDAFKGYQGNTLPLEYPVNVTLDTWSRDIYLRDLDMYMMNTSYLGDGHKVHIYPPDNIAFGVSCAKDQIPSVSFSVSINGVDYPVDQSDLVRPWGRFAAWGNCNVGVVKSSLDTHTLGMTFLRSVYLAYRFPTGSCPGYWGFAIPKGGATPTQRPKTTPSDAAQCLSFATPTSTPSPNVAASSNIYDSSLFGASTKKFRVYGRPIDETVVLRGIDDLPPLKAAGGISGFGG
ncbi:acid protease [Ceratobasidium sp. AG-I]|nr:acid protease [Ceratobasidium sp. AG-I]